MVAGGRDSVLPRSQHHDPFVAALKQAGASELTEWVPEDDHAFSASRIALSKQLVDWLQQTCW